MIYAQIKSGRKLHLAMQPGEMDRRGNVVRAGYLSAPICGTPLRESGYRMTCNLPLNHSCRRCVAVRNRMSN